MTRPEILAAISEVARAHLGVERPLTGEERLVEDLKLDSLGLVILAAEVENRFRVALSAEDEARIATVGDLAAVLEAKLAAAGC